MKTNLFSVKSLSLLFVGIVAAINPAFAAQKRGYEVTYSQMRSNEMRLSFNFHQVSISEVTINGTTYSKINFDGQLLSNKKGYAELPIVSTAVQLSADKNVTVSAEPGTYTDYQLNYPLLPSRGIIYRNQDPNKIPYIIDQQSIVNAWYPGNMVDASEPFIYRDVRGTTVSANPVQYNAATKTVRVYNSIIVKMIENDSKAINALEVQNKYVDPEMFTAYNSMFINYNQRANWANEIGEHGEILVISTSRDAAAIKPYIDWKKQMGYKVNQKEVATGTNAKTTIKTEYTNNNKILYVLMVGDWADIKSDMGTSGNAPMDPMLGCVVGTDLFPDIYIGRFSAASATDVTTQVNKTLKYEKTPSGTWYKTSLHIGSSEGSGQGDDGEMDKTHQDNIWIGRLSKFTYTTKKTAYDPGASASTVSSAVNAGLGVINYTGHGSNSQFLTSGFSSSNVNSLTNGDKLPFIFSVACVNGEFHTGTCFAEAWLRKVNGGAVATLMATISQPWVPPMIGQDYMNDLLTGGYTYQNNTTAPGKGTNTDHGKTHFGSITFNGECLMLAELNNTSSQETIQTWTIFGDPSLQVRTDEAKPLVVSNANVTAGSYVTNISVNGAPFANALVSIWDGANQPFSALTDANGNVTISHTLATGTNATLTVTGFNLIPFIKTVAISTGTSVANDNIVGALNIYPNPSNGEFNISYSLVNNENSSIKVLDVTGKVIYSDILKQNVQSKKIALDNIENGIYFLQFQNNSGTVTKKLNIQK